MAAQCQRYESAESQYSPEGRQALRRIRPVLAEGLKNDMEMNPGKSGKEVQKDWVQNHPQVYKEAGVCDLPMGDKAQIIAHASPVLMQNPSMMSQAASGATGSAINSAMGRDPLSPPYRAASSSATAPPASTPAPKGKADGEK